MPNASIDYQLHRYDDTPDQRINKNGFNVAAYFQGTPDQDTTLQIAAGQNVVPGALSEDIRIYGTEPALLVTLDESLARYLPAGKSFAKVIVVNARNISKRNLSYQWVFAISAPVLRSRGTLTIVGVDPDQPSIAWVLRNEETVRQLGFFRLSPGRRGMVQRAPETIRSMKGSMETFAGMTEFSMADAVQIVWGRK